MNLNLSSIAKPMKSIQTMITANSPVLLVGAAVAGVVTTGILAAKGGYKARGIIDEAEEESGFELTTQQKFQLTWLCYAVPAVTGVSTIASCVGVHVIHNKRHAALAALYTVTSSKLDDLRAEAEEMLGNKKTQTLNNAIGQRAVDANPVENNEIIILDEAAALCHDEWSGRWFMGSVPKIEKAIAAINLQLAEDGDASLNDFYGLLGLSPIPMGDRFGWAKSKIEGRFASVFTTDGRTAISIGFQDSPKDNLGVR